MDSRWPDGGDAFGGAISLSRVSVFRVQDTTFENNQALAGSGGVARNIACDVITRGIPGHASGGAVMAARCGDVKIINCTAEKHLARSYFYPDEFRRADSISFPWRTAGGSFWVRGDTILIENSRISQSSVRSEISRGGAMWIASGSVATIRSSSFSGYVEGPFATGGCLFLAPNSSASFISTTLSNCTVRGSGNPLDRCLGGGIATRCPHRLAFIDSIISNAVAECQFSFGGAVAFMDPENSTTLESPCLSRTTLLFFANSTFRNSSASFGGAIYLAKTTLMPSPEWSSARGNLSLEDNKGQHGQDIAIIRGATFSNDLARAMDLENVGSVPSVFVAHAALLPQVWATDGRPDSCGELRVIDSSERFIWPGHLIPPLRVLDCFNNSFYSTNSDISAILSPDPILCPKESDFKMLLTPPYSNNSVLWQIPVSPNQVINCSRTPMTFKAEFPLSVESPVVEYALGSCPPGTELKSAFYPQSCALCLEGSYTLETGPNKSCTRCPSEAACLQFNSETRVVTIFAEVYLAAKREGRNNSLVPCWSPPACREFNCTLRPLSCGQNSTCNPTAPIEWDWSDCYAVNACTRGYEGSACSRCTCNSSICFYATPSNECFECRVSEALPQVIGPLVVFVLALGIYIALPGHTWPFLLLEAATIIFLIVCRILQDWFFNSLMGMAFVWFAVEQKAGSMGHVMSFVLLMQLYAEVDRELLPKTVYTLWLQYHEAAQRTPLGIECFIPAFKHPWWQFMQPIIVTLILATFVGIVALLRYFVLWKCHKKKVDLLQSDYDSAAEPLNPTLLDSDTEEDSPISSKYSSVDSENASMWRDVGRRLAEGKMNSEVADKLRREQGQRRHWFSVFLESFVLHLIVSAFWIASAAGDVHHPCDFGSMYHFPDIPCTGSKRPFVGASFGLLAISLILPLTIGVSLFWNRRAIISERPIYWIRFLHAPFKPSRWYFIVIWMLARVILAYSLSAVSNPLFRASIIMTTLMAALAFHLNLLPYETDRENQTTTFAYAVLILTLGSLHSSTGACSDSDPLCQTPEVNPVVGFLALVGLNLICMVALIFFAVFPIVKRMLRKVKFCERWMAKPKTENNRKRWTVEDS